MNKSKEIANKTATQAVRTGKDVGSFAKKKVGDIADDINEVAKAENKQKAITKIANKTATDAVITGKKVGSFAKKQADVVVQLATSEDTKKAIASTTKAVAATTKSAIKIVDKKVGSSWCLYQSDI